MENEIQVGMDGEWKSARSPDWLTTLGVSTCIAVAIANDDSKKAWLIHSPTFGHDASQLEEMLADATKQDPNGVTLKVWVFGGTAADLDCEEETRTARGTV